MKKLVSFTLIPLFFMFTQNVLASCHDDEHVSETKTESIQPNTKVIKVTGMTCKSCVRHVEKELQAIKLLPGLKFKVELNLITLDFNENKTAAPNEIEKILEEARTVLTKNKYQIVETKG